MTDAHVHVGYFPRKGCSTLMYYSPRRIVGILNRCGVGDFVVSSTCAQIEEVTIDDMIAEALELKRQAGKRAHIFFWLSWHLYEQDHSLSWIDSKLFEGVKFHEKETPWITVHRKVLAKILSRLESCNMPVQFHTGDDTGCRPHDFRILSRLFPSLRFDLAHCRDMQSSAEMVSECPNVYVDTAYLPNERMHYLAKYDWQGRLMFGSDIPIWQAYEEIGLTQKYRSMIRCFNREALSSDAAFKAFVGCS